MAYFVIIAIHTVTNNPTQMTEAESFIREDWLTKSRVLYLILAIGRHNTIE